MGLLIHTTFETKEGLQVQSVYSRIISLSCSFRGDFVDIAVTQETYVDRTKRLQGYTPIFVPTIEYRVCSTVSHDSNWGSVTFLYEKIKERLVELGFTVEDVLEVSTSQQSSE